MKCYKHSDMLAVSNCKICTHQFCKICITSRNICFSCKELSERRNLIYYSILAWFFSILGNFLLILSIYSTLENFFSSDKASLYYYLCSIFTSIIGIVLSKIVLNKSLSNKKGRGSLIISLIPIVVTILFVYTIF